MAVTLTRTGRRSDAMAGAVAIAPFVVAYVPFALVIGSTVATLDDPLAGWAGSWLIYGGSAHLTALHGIADGTLLVAVATALLVNARLVVYGASMASRWRHQPRWFRLVAPALLIDPTWALAGGHTDAHGSDGYGSEEHGPDGRGVEDARAHRHFFLAAGIVLGAGWSTAIAAGALLGDRLPDVGLELAAPLCLIALVGPRLRDRTQRWAAIAAGVTAAATAELPAGSGIALAIGAGSVAAHLAERSSP